MRKIIYSAVITTGIITTLVAGTALASTMRANWFNHTGNRPTPVVMGIVTAINGTSLTVTDKKNTAYIIDDSAAKVTKGFGPKAQPLTIADIKVGDQVAVIGTANGNAITATAITDGAGIIARGDKKTGNKSMNGVAGIISNVNGASFTITLPIRPNNTSTPAKVFTVNTTTSTTFTKDGQATDANVVVNGAQAKVRGTVDTAALTVSAARVNIITKTPTLPKNRPFVHKPTIKKIGEKK